MNYKETLFFIGKALTINHEKHNKTIVENELKSNNIDWDAVVKVSTAHFVFPALYCNLKRADFLHYLPSDLVVYMKHITDLNRERNQQIIDQSKEINKLLLENNITPIFLKGTGNLLEGLYEDIGERMVGDIDIIIEKSKINQSFNLLKNHNYISNSKILNDHRHLARLVHKNKIGAIEIHKELLINKFTNEFNYDFIKKDSQIINNTYFSSYSNQLNLSIIAKQINDKGFYFKNISLRNAYDVFLLSKKTIAKVSFDKFIELKKPLNCFLACCSEVFNHPKSLEYSPTLDTESYLKIFKKHLNNPKLKNKHFKRTENYLFIKSCLSIVFKSFYKKEYREWLIKRTTDKNWQRKKLVQLGLRKPKPTS